MSQYLCPSCWRVGAGVAVVAAPAVAAPAVAAPEPEPISLPEREREPEPVVAAPAAVRPRAKIGPRFWLEHPERPGRVDASRPAEKSARPSRAEPAPAAEKAAKPAPEKAGRGAIAALLDTVLGDADGEPAETVEGPIACACGAPLGKDARLDGAPSLLGFAGATGAGKSVLLLSMLQQLELADPPPFALAGLAGADLHFRGLRRELFLHGARPPAAGSATGHGWKIAGAGKGSGAGLRGSRSQYLGFHEAAVAGGDAERRHLGLVNRLVFVVDGARIARDLGLGGDDAWSGEDAAAGAADWGAAELEAFAAACAGLGKRTRETALAIVVAKADLLAASEAWSGLATDGFTGAARQDLVRQLLQASYRGQLWTQAQQLFRRAGLFAVSGLGFRPAPEDLGEGGRLRRKPAPAGVLSPLEFLLEDVLPRPLSGRGPGKDT